MGDTSAASDYEERIRRKLEKEGTTGSQAKKPGRARRTTVGDSSAASDYEERIRRKLEGEGTADSQTNKSGGTKSGTTREAKAASDYEERIRRKLEKEGTTGSQTKKPGPLRRTTVGDVNAASDYEERIRRKLAKDGAAGSPTKTPGRAGRTTAGDARAASDYELVVRRKLANERTDDGGAINSSDYELVVRHKSEGTTAGSAHGASDYEERLRRKLEGEGTGRPRGASSSTVVGASATSGYEERLRRKLENEGTGGSQTNKPRGASSGTVVGASAASGYEERLRRKLEHEGTANSQTSEPRAARSAASDYEERLRRKLENEGAANSQTSKPRTARSSASDYEERLRRKLENETAANSQTSKPRAARSAASDYEERLRRKLESETAANSRTSKPRGARRVTVGGENAPSDYEARIRRKLEGERTAHHQTSKSSFEKNARKEKQNCALQSSRTGEDDLTVATAGTPESGLYHGTSACINGLLSIITDLQRFQEENGNMIPMSHPSFTRIMDKFSSVGMEQWLDKRWDYQCASLKAFKREHGDYFIPVTHPTLGEWVRTQCDHFKLCEQDLPSPLTKKRYKKLVHIGFDEFVKWEETNKKQVEDSPASACNHGSLNKKEQGSAEEDNGTSEKTTMIDERDAKSRPSLSRASPPSREDSLALIDVTSTSGKEDVNIDSWSQLSDVLQSTIRNSCRNLNVNAMDDDDSTAEEQKPGDKDALDVNSTGTASEKLEEADSFFDENENEKTIKDIRAELQEKTKCLRRTSDCMVSRKMPVIMEDCSLTGKNLPREEQGSAEEDNGTFEKTTMIDERNGKSRPSLSRASPPSREESLTLIDVTSALSEEDVNVDSWSQLGDVLQSTVRNSCRDLNVNAMDDDDSTAEEQKPGDKDALDVNSTGTASEKLEEADSFFDENENEKTVRDIRAELQEKTKCLRRPQDCMASRKMPVIMEDCSLTDKNLPREESLRMVNLTPASSKGDAFIDSWSQLGDVLQSTLTNSLSDSAMDDENSTAEKQGPADTEKNSSVSSFNSTDTASENLTLDEKIKLKKKQRKQKAQKTKKPKKAMPRRATVQS